MITWVFIGFFDHDGIELYRDANGTVKRFSSHSQASQFIIQKGLGIHASPIEVSQYELPERN